MQNSDWGGHHAARPESRISERVRHAPPEAQAYAPHPYAPHAAPRGVASHQVATGYGWGDAHGAVPPDEPALAGVAFGALFGRVLHGAGALLSVALIAGLAVWGYKLAIRDATGVPVVRALEAPMRIQPENPGGEAAAHQGLAVNTIAAEGQAEAPAARVALAPAPIALEPEDLPAQNLAEVSAVPMTEAADAVRPNALAPVALVTDATALAEADEMAVTDAEEDVAAALAMADALTEGQTPLSGAPTEETAVSEAESRLAAAILPAYVPGVARSPRPAPRPADFVMRASANPIELAVASAAAATMSATPSVREVDASQVAVGTRLVQLGAFDTAEVARAEWETLAQRFPEMLEGKERVVEEAQSGGKTFYRLRALGFADISDARRFCAALTAGQAACIPVVTR